MKSTRLATLCAALGLASFFNSGAQAQITVDGTRDAGYDARATVQTTPSSWGGGNTLASLSFKQVGATLNVFLAGRANGNQVYLFIDSKTGGANKLVNNLISSANGDEWRLNNFGTSATQGLTFESAFTADYAIAIESGGWTHFFPIDTANPQPRSYIGNSFGTNSASGGSVTLLKADPSNDVADASTHDKGFEFALNLNSLGVPSGATNYPIRFMALIINGGVNYMGNQTLGSLPGSQTGDVGGWGNFQALNFETLAGTQTVTVNVDNADFDGDGQLDGVDTDDDNDGLLDTVETGTGIWVSSSDTGTNPKNVDTDGDGLNDGVETNTGTYVGVLDTGSNPLVADDFDRDKLPDFFDTDDDNDTLVDTVETNTGTWVSASNTGTNPKNADTDGDGLRDNVETNTGSYTSASDTGTSPLVADQARVFLVGNDVLFPGGSWQVDNTNNQLSPAVGGPFSAKSVTKPIANPGVIEFKFTGGNWDINWGILTNTVISLNTNTGTISGTLLRDKVPTTNDITINLRMHRAKGEYVFSFNDATNSLQFSVARKTYATLADYVAAYGLTGSDALGTADVDSDGLDNQAEFTANSAPNLADTDGDGLTDADELSGSGGALAATSPTLIDTDGDGLLDLWELTNQLNPTIATGNDGADGDPDGDGVSNLLEQANGTNPNSANPGFSSPYNQVRLFGDFNGWSGDPTWQNTMRLTANNTWEAMIYVTSTSIPATNGFKFITVQQNTNTAFWGRVGGVSSTVAVKNAAENLLTTNVVSGTNYYHFTFNDFTGASSVTRVNPQDDSDGDLLPDAWEQFYGRFAKPALTNTPWLAIGTNYNNTADLSDNGTQTNLTTGQKYQRGFNPVEDVIPPSISLVGDEVLVVGTGQAFVDPGVEVRDNHLTLVPTVTTNTGNLPFLLSESSNGVTGWQSVQYVAQDGATNRATNGVRKVIVGDWTVGYGGPIYYNLQIIGTGGTTWNRFVTNTQAGNFEVYAQFYRQGATEGTNRTDPKVSCWIGVTTNTNASTGVEPDWNWTPAILNSGNNSGNDEYRVTFTNLAPGTYQVVSRWQFDGTNKAFGYGGLNEDNQGGALGLTIPKVVGTGTNAVTNQIAYLPGSITVTAVSVGYAKIQFPTAPAPISVGDSFDVYFQFYSAGVTEAAGAPTWSGVQAQLGYSLAGGDPSVVGAYTWVNATFNAQMPAPDANNDEYKGTLTGLAAGTYSYAVRFSVDGGATWAYGGKNGIWSNDSATLVVNKATPTITVAPTASAITAGQALSASILNGGTASVPGTFAWTDGTTVPNATGSYGVTFTPTDSANYNNATTTVSVTVNPSGSTFAGWSGGATLNSANVGKYAIGGASSLSATDGVAPTSTVSGGNLVLTAIVRVDDAKVSVVGEAVTSLADYAPGGTVSTVSGVDAADQTGVPTGHKRQTFTVAQGADARKFLRLKATLAP